MKLAYSCAGEGFGHASRLVTLLPHLEARYEVGLFLPAAVVPYVTARVGPRPSLPIPGLHFAHRGSRVLALESLRLAAPVVASFPFTVAALSRRLKREGYQAVISDFEPHLAWAARLAGLPVFQLNHPGVMARVRQPGWEAAAATWGGRLMEGPWDERVLVSFFDGDVGPLLRPSLTRRPPTTGTQVVINLKPSYRPRVLEVLRAFPKLNWKLFPSPGEDFDTALLDCAAVVSPAGHQVLAEALALGKPVLVLPQQGQPEQTLNATKLAETGRGRVGSLETLESDLRAFLADLPRYREPRPLPQGFNLTNGTGPLLTRLERFLTRRAS